MVRIGISKPKHRSHPAGPRFTDLARCCSESASLDCLVYWPYKDQNILSAMATKATGHKDTSKMKLYVLSWGLYPRRVTIYLKEKKIMDDFEIINCEVTKDGMSHIPGKPPGTFPMLEYSPGQYIFQSTAILEYLEDRYPQAPNMRGRTLEAAARVRQLMDVFNELCAFFGMYIRNASQQFAAVLPQSEETARRALDRCHKMLTLVDKWADPEGPMLANSTGQLTIVDCVAMATFQFAEYIYGLEILQGHPRLEQFFAAFSRNPSTELDEAPDFVREKSRILSVT